MPQVDAHLLVGLDVNASRVRAAAGSAGAPQLQPLDGKEPELPAAISLEGRTLEVGRAGAGLCRRLPHLACLDFLHHLDRPRAWAVGRHRLDASRAVSLLLERVQPLCRHAHGLALAVPAYLDLGQVALLTELAGKAKLPVLGSLAAPLAAALAGHAEHPWAGPALIGDIDEHALTWAVVHADDGHARVLDVQVVPQLGLRAWKERLLNTVADRCVRQSRRDPRDSAPAEQALYEQLDAALDAARDGRLADLAVATAHWYQNLILRPEELSASCAPLLRQALGSLKALRPVLASQGGPGAVLLTAAAGRLPGLVAALEENAAPSPERDEPAEDFGEDLFLAATVGGPVPVHVLWDEAVSRAAHDAAARFARGEVHYGHLEAAPLPPPQPADAGPARLHYRGRDYVLCGLSFSLGRHPDCDLVFDTESYPAVSARHCEIAFEQRAYVLRDRSSHGTFLNDRPVVEQLPLHAGDWIRLGPHGPLLRFLGQAMDRKRATTTA